MSSQIKKNTITLSEILSTKTAVRGTVAGNSGSGLVLRRLA